MGKIVFLEKIVIDVKKLDNYVGLQAPKGGKNVELNILKIELYMVES